MIGFSLPLVTKTDATNSSRDSGVVSFSGPEASAWEPEASWLDASVSEDGPDSCSDTVSEAVSEEAVPSTEELSLEEAVPGISEETPGSWKSEAEPPSASPDGSWLETVSDAELFSSSAQAVIGDIWRTNKKDSKTAVALNPAFFLMTNPPQYFIHKLIFLIILYINFIQNLFYVYHYF